MTTGAAFLLENAVGAALLALVGLALGRCCPQPRLLRAVWLLVLAKLVCPPLLRVPLPVAEQLASFVGEGAASRAVGASGAASWTWWQLLGAAWIAGALGTWIGAWWSARGFRRVLASGRDAPPWLAREADDAARDLGLARAPRLVLVEARLSPCLFGLGRRLRLVLPAGLVTRLSPEERRMILGHELVHALHKDPWVRLFECLVTGLFWWHPVLWLARGQLRRWEERERDAHLLSRWPDGRRPYARALLATVDYLSARHEPVALVSRLFERRDFSERFRAVLQGDGHRVRRRRWVLLAVFLLWSLGPMTADGPTLGLELVGGSRTTRELASSAWTVSAHDPAGTFELALDGQDVLRVVIDDEALPASRWRQRPGVLEVLRTDRSVDFAINVHDDRSITWLARPPRADS